MTAEDIFQEVAEGRVDICRRCFKLAESSGVMDSLGGGPSCGEDCSTMSATLEDEPISRSEMVARGSRLLVLIQEQYNIDEETYSEAIELLADEQQSPRSLFLDAIRAGRGDVSLPELMSEHGISSEETQRTQSFLWGLPSSSVSEEDLEEIDDRVVSALSTVTDSCPPGTGTFYISDVDAIPQEFHPIRANRPSQVIRLVIQEHEGWFWRVSPETAETWLYDMDENLRECVAECLYGFIRSREQYTTRDSPPPEEQFRRTGLWPVLNNDAEDIMGYLRRNDGPQSLEDIADYIGHSESTARTILTILESTERASGDSSDELWRAGDIL